MGHPSFVRKREAAPSDSNSFPSRQSCALLDKREPDLLAVLGGFVGDVGLDGVLDQLSAAVQRQLVFDMSLVSFDGFDA
jgi:hypothetical protein